MTAIPSVRLSVATPVLRQNSLTYTEMVEIISQPDSPIILAFGQLIAVTKFGRRSPLGPNSNRTSNAGAVLRDFKSLCKGPTCISETVQDSYNRGPFKSKIVCPLALAVIFISLMCQSQLTSTLTNLLSSSSRRLKECVLPPAMFCRHRMFAVRHDASRQLPSNFHRGSAARARLPVKVPLSTETVRTSVCDGSVFIGFVVTRPV